MIKFLSNNFIFKFLSFFIKPLISADVRYEGKEEFNQNYRIIYALSSESLIDLIVLNKVCKKQNITSPFDSLPNSKLKQFVSLKTPKYIVSEQKFQRQKTFNLEEILEVEKDIVIIPVSISWGKRPDKQQSLFKIIFSPSWRPAGSIKKIFKLLVHGRNIQIQFEKGLHVTDEIDLEKTNLQNSLILSRYLRAVFRKSKQAMLGPDISHRRTLVQSLVRNSHVRDEIKKLSDGKISRQRQLSKKAYKYANEICSDLNYPIVSLLVAGFTWFWNTRYDGLHTKNIDKIREISKENSLIFVPCHRSHIDYCALSYLLHENGLMLPQVAAGNNLNLPIIGGILRGGGGVFMRRSFMNNSLYSVVFFEYIRALMTRGSSIEFFPEGGRSRTGLSLPARPGLLSLTLRSFASLKVKQVKVVPVYIGYEKILEGQSYLSELSGGKKKTESIFDPFKVFKDFRNYLGNAYLNFSEPIDLETFLKENVGEDYEIQSPQEKPEWLDKVTNELGESVTRSINNSVAVTSSSLFAVALLTEPTQTLSKEDLTKRINFFLGLIEDTPDYKDVWLTQKDTEEIILKTEKLGFIQSKMIGSKKIYRPTSDQVATLSFYKNNIAHIFVLYSLICESVKFVNRAPKDKVIKLIQMIYPIFSKDFHLKNKMVDDIFIEQAIDVLIRKGLLELEDEVINAPSEHSRYREEYIALSNLCEPSLKRFYIAMSVIWNKEMILKEDFRKECKDIAKKLEALEGWPYPEFSDSAKFDNFLYMMIRTKFFKEDEMNLLSASKITKKAKIGYEQFFDKEFIGFIDKQLI
jgi:glycerol-3-phosphate O-acyltransferase